MVGHALQAPGQRGLRDEHLITVSTADVLDRTAQDVRKDGLNRQVLSRVRLVFCIIFVSVIYLLLSI